MQAKIVNGEEVVAFEWERLVSLLDSINPKKAPACQALVLGHPLVTASLMDQPN